jgi:hypothetical protein
MPVKSDLLLRLLIADLVGERVTRESIVALREDLADCTHVSTRPRPIR